MHKLDRTSVASPTCITPHDPDRRYERLRAHEKAEIRQRLFDLQAPRCAYCERRTGTGENDGHIEHFRRQVDFPSLTTRWDNLFWSCTDSKFCGKHKDNCNIVGSPGTCRAFNPDDIIKPCTDDPEYFMHFISDGSINPRPNLSPAELHRYQETLRVFQLADAAFLVDSRRDAVKPYLGFVRELEAMGQEMVQAYVSRELARFDSTMPFATAIRHFLLSIANESVPHQIATQVD